jgi:hypothetical protein
MNRDNDMTGAEGKWLSTLADALQGGWRMWGVVEFKGERMARPWTRESDQVLCQLCCRGIR